MFDGNHIEKKPFGRTIFRWKDIIKILMCRGVGWVVVVYDRSNHELS
jgi:hypothetical protein